MNQDKGQREWDCVRLQEVNLPRKSSTLRSGHTLPVYVDDIFIRERQNGIEDARIIYENPLIPNSGRNSAACEKEVCCTTKETTRYPQFSQNSTRLATFVHGLFFIEHQALADLGFFYKGQGDRVCCYECGISLYQWKTDDDPLLEHIRYSPECRYLSTIIDTTTLQDYKAQLLIIRGNESRQVATGVGLQITSSQDERRKIRFLEYSSYDVRLSTFARFPAISGLDVKQIAAAGFYYTDHQDIVRCYACDGCLQQWEAGDDPWEEHSRWFPDCHHLKQSNYQMPEKKTKAETDSIDPEKKSAASVENASISEGLAQRLKTLTLKEQEPKQQEAELDLNTPAVLAVLDFGYSRKSAMMAIKELRKKGKTTITATGIMQVLVSFEYRGVSLPADDDAKENDSKHSILSDLQNMSSKDLLSKEQLAKRKTNKTLPSETKTNEVCHLPEENEKLIKQMMCKRCKAKQRNILVLPCTHLCLCEHCCNEVSLCPECWKPIKERVRTYFL